MPPSCSARTNRENNPSVTCHRFPKIEELREKWIRATKRANFNPSKSAVLCSCHFAEDIDRTSVSCVRICSDRVPTISGFPKHLQSDSKSRKRPFPRQPECDVEDVGDAIPVPCITPEKASLKRKLEQAELKLASSRKRIKLLQQSRRCLIKKNADLKNIIRELCDDLVSSESQG